MMTSWPEGNAVVYAEGNFQISNGKTAHGLVRRTRRYHVVGVVDSTCAGQDAGSLLDGVNAGIPIAGSVGEAVELAKASGRPATHLVIGLAPEGGGLPPSAIKDLVEALHLGLNLDSGLHDFLSEIPELAELAAQKGLVIRDVRKTPPRSELHFFSGRIDEVDCLKIAILGTDSAVGKRTTAWILVEALTQAGLPAEMIGTGQTAWLQGAQYGIILDSLINDFVAGELEHAVWSAWRDRHPQVIVIEGQGSLMNPAYPGGFEILAAARPDGIVIQHAPARKEYDGFPGWPVHRLEKQIQVLEMISGKPVIAVTLNHEGLTAEELIRATQGIVDTTGLPVVDPLLDGPSQLVQAVRSLARERGSQ